MDNSCSWNSILNVCALGIFDHNWIKSSPLQQHLFSDNKLFPSANSLTWDRSNSKQQQSNQFPVDKIRSHPTFFAYSRSCFTLIYVLGKKKCDFHIMPMLKACSHQEQCNKATPHNYKIDWNVASLCKFLQSIGIHFFKLKGLLLQRCVVNIHCCCE